MSSFKQRLLIPILILFLLFPNITIEGAGNGLFLWYHSLVPALLPFLMMTQLFLYSGSYVMIFSFFCGYPTAARLANERFISGIIPPKKAQFYLYLCNNTGIAFLVGYVHHTILQNHVPLWKFLLCLYLPQLLFCSFYYIIFLRHTEAESTGSNQSKTISITLDQAMGNAFSIVIKIGGYIMLFSIVANYVSCFPLNNQIKTLLLGILEITNGLQALSKLPIGIDQKSALAVAFCSFGGICSIAQTKSVLTSPNLSIWKYSFAKLFYAFCSYFLCTLII